MDSTGRAPRALLLGYTFASAEVLQQKTIYVNWRAELHKCYDTCQSALAKGYVLSNVNTQILTTVSLQGLEWRVTPSLIKKDLGLSS